MRSILRPGHVKISRSMRKTLRQHRFEITIDTRFEEVVNSCAAPRATQVDTWITPAMRDAYTRLHRNGHAHSVECSLEGQLVGGLYGVTVGCAFFGESMFSRANDASKIALITLSEQLKRWGYEIIDCQIHNPHLASMGAMEIPRREFLQILSQSTRLAPAKQAWDEALISSVTP